MATGVLECVVNVSEGRDRDTIAALAGAASPVLLDVHSDPDHHRSVLTLGGPPELVEPAARSLARAALSRIDLAGHSGVHPRLGALDVVPWVALTGAPLADARLEIALSARDRFARWAATELGLPCFLYGPERSLPELRRQAWNPLEPDLGPRAPHRSAGAVAVGARPVLVAYNLWLAEPDLDLARRIAAQVRGPHLRTLGLRVGRSVQVSCNLVAPWSLGPGAAYDAVAGLAQVERAELVGLVPAAVVEREPPRRWPELGLSPSATIEARLEQAGLDGGSFIY